MKIELVILGSPKALKRHRTYTKDRNGKPFRFPIQVDPSEGDKSDLLAVVRDNAPDLPFTCPLRVDITFYFARPKNHFRTGKFAGILKPNAPTWHISRPDRDNLDKLILDALSGKFWINDSIVCDGRLRKFYDEKPRTEIVISVIQLL